MPSSILIPPLGGSGGVTPVPATNRGIVVWDNVGAQFITLAGNLISANGAISAAGATVTANEPILLLSQTWNNGAVTFFGIDANFTTTAAAAASRLIRLRTNGTSVFEVGPVGSVTFPGSLNMGAGATNPQATLNGGTVTADTPVLLISQTWNSGAVVFTAVRVNITNTASSTNSPLLDLQVGGTSQVQMRRNGKIYAAAFLLPTATGGTLEINNDSGGQTGVMYCNPDFLIRWGSSLYGTADIGLRRDGATGALAIRAGTQAEILRVYRTWTDASNYERQSLQSGSGYFEWAAETAGTGTDNIDLRLTPAGTGLVMFGTHSAIAAETVTGYITVKDAAGNTRKLAVVS